MATSARRRASLLLSSALFLLAGFAVSGCTLSVEPARAICRGDSVNVDHVDTALVACSTLDSLARQ